MVTKKTQKKSLLLRKASKKRLSRGKIQFKYLVYLVVVLIAILLLTEFIEHKNSWKLQGFSMLNKNVKTTATPNLPGWKTYTDKYGFSFKYPPSWELQPDLSTEDNETAEDIIITIDPSDPNKDSIQLEIRVGQDANPVNGKIPTYAPPLLTLNDLMKDNLQIYNPPSVKLVHLAIGGYPAYELKSNNGTSFEYYQTIAPGLGDLHAIYFFDFQNPNYPVIQQVLGASPEESVYPITDPFIQQELLNFNKLVGSIKFPSKN